MARSMYVEIQPWITMGKSPAEELVAPRTQWVDAAGFDAVMFHVDISVISLTSGDGLLLQTAVTDDERSFATMKNAAGQESAFTTAQGPDNATFIVPAHSDAPLRRWVRWALTPGVGGATFRITALFRSPG